MEKNDNIREGVAYLIFGVLTTIVNYAVFFVFKKAGVTDTDAGLTLSNAVAWTAAVAFAFFTNKKWVFNSKTSGFKETVAEAAKFVGGRLFTGIFEIVLPTPLSKLFKKGFDFSLFGKDIVIDGQWIAKILVSVLIIIMNYIISKFIVFKKDKNSTENEQG